MYKTKCNRCASPEMEYTKRSAIGCIFQCLFTGNEMYKTKLPLFAYKEKHVGKKHYLFLHKDFDRSKKLSQFTFNGQNFFWLTPCKHKPIHKHIQCTKLEEITTGKRDHCIGKECNKTVQSIGKALGFDHSPFVKMVVGS